MAPEQLLVLALFFLVTLVSLIAQWLRGRTERRVETGAPEEIRKAPPRVPPRVVTGTPQPSPQRAPAPAAVPVPAEPPPVRRPSRLRLGDASNVRYGIVLLTVLGPCRALDPPKLW